MTVLCVLYLVLCRVECSKAIEWVKEGSAGMCFLSLQADKYGYRMLPKFILQEVLETHLRVRECVSEVKEVIFSWYTLDENSKPGRYVLRTLVDKDDSVYWSDYRVMLSALNGMSIEERSYPGAGLRVGQSVTEWEMRAVLSGTIEEARVGRICWSHRRLAGDIDNILYKDTEEDSTAERYFKELKAKMLQELPPRCVQTYTSDLTLYDMTSCEATTNLTEYLHHFKQFTSLKMKESLRNIFSLKKKWQDDALGLGIPGVAAAEILHHAEWAHNKCSNFCGRDGLISEVLALVAGDGGCASGVADNTESRFGGISGCVIGVSGAGERARGCIGILCLYGTVVNIYILPYMCKYIISY